jgi:hypothetical protein
MTNKKVTIQYGYKWKFKKLYFNELIIGRLLADYWQVTCYRSQFGLDNHLSFYALRLCLKALSDIV